MFGRSKDSGDGIDVDADPRDNVRRGITRQVGVEDYLTSTYPTAVDAVTGWLQARPPVAGEAALAVPSPLPPMVADTLRLVKKERLDEYMKVVEGTVPSEEATLRLREIHADEFVCWAVGVKPWVNSAEEPWQAADALVSQGAAYAVVHAWEPWGLLNDDGEKVLEALWVAAVQEYTAWLTSTQRATLAPPADSYVPDKYGY